MAKSLYEVKLEARRKKSKKDTIVTDMDYVLRDKDAKDALKNTRDMTPGGVNPGDYTAKHSEEIEELKKQIKEATGANEATKDTNKELEELREQIKALQEASKPKSRASTGAK
jgi:archaellum component FlaC